MRALFLPLVIVGLSGCITSGKRPGAEDAGDTVVADGADDVVGDDAAGDVSGAETVSACIFDEDCALSTPLGVCQQARCIDEICYAEPADGGTPCEDGDPCTTSDTCAGGQCLSGWATDCAALGPCWELTGAPVCDPQSGCPAIQRPVGTACSDVTVPTCDFGWAIPAPACSASGECVDRSGEVPNGIHPLAGTWYLVTSSSEQGSYLYTTRALLELGGTLGTWTATHVVSTSPDRSWVLETGDEPGTFCMGLDGDVTLEHAGFYWDGFVDESMNVMVLAGEQGGELAVAVRVAADGTLPDGDYAFIGTGYAGGAEAIPSFGTRVGVVHLKGGCVQKDSTFGPAPGLGSTLRISDLPDDCFEPVDGLLRLDAEVSTTDGISATTPFQLVGVPALGGDVLLLTREDGGLTYGTILLVRKGLRDPRDLLGKWRFVSQRGGLGSLGQTDADQRLEDGWLRLGEEHAISGELLGFGLATDIVGGWWAASEDGRYSHRASFGNDLVHHTGEVALSAPFVVAWSTSAATDPSTPVVLPPLIADGSLFVMVRPARVGRPVRSP